MTRSARRIRRATIPLLLVPALLAGCGRSQSPAAGGASADEQTRLDKAAEMLDANSVSANAVAPDEHQGNAT